MQAQSGWGVKPDECEASTNQVLERKCPFFWRLEEIWGSHPNTSVIHNTETIAAIPPLQANSLRSCPRLQASIEPASEPLSESASQMPSMPPSEPASEPASRRGSPTVRSTPAPLQPKRSEKRDFSTALKRAFEDRQAIQQELGLKRIKAGKEVKMEIARIQADAQVKQMEIFAWC